MTNQHAPDAQEESTRDRAPSSALNDLAVQLGVTLNRHSMYPSGHPSLSMALDDLLRRFRELLAGRQSLVIVAARVVAHVWRCGLLRGRVRIPVGIFISG